MNEMKLKRYWRTQLPHWEVECGVYFITIRCAGSLPRVIIQRLSEIQQSLAVIEPASDEFALLQRRYFMTIEKYLDSGQGFAPFKDPRCCHLVVDRFRDLQVQGWDVRHFVIMPNHVHLVVWAKGATAMAETWKRWKGRISHDANQVLGRSGSFWQRDWFDRVMRSEAETIRVIRYVHNNPIKAGLGEGYEWLQ